MPQSKRGHFGGLFDTFAELNRMREHWQQVEASAEVRTQANAWVPVLDIYAREDDLVIRCELAGVEQGDVQISLSSGMLWISGDRAGDPEDENVAYYVRERLYGPFRRGIHLPESARPEQIHAVFVNGLLEITIEGAVAAQQEQAIEISSGDSTAVRVNVGGGES